MNILLVCCVHTEGLNCRWDCLKDSLLGDWMDGIFCSFGMPVIKGLERYNYQVLCLNRKIVMIRPKMCLANDGNYRELRWSTAWNKEIILKTFFFQVILLRLCLRKPCPFGYGYVQFLDTYALMSFEFDFIFSRLCLKILLIFTYSNYNSCLYSLPPLK